MTDNTNKEQILAILNELNPAKIKTTSDKDVSTTDKVIKLFGSQHQIPSTSVKSEMTCTRLSLRRISFGLSCMIFSVFIMVTGFFYLPKDDQLPFISASIIVLLLGAWQIDKGNKENVKRNSDNT